MIDRMNRGPKRRLNRAAVHPALTVTVHVIVPFQDADPSGVAWHGNYFRYFDTARCALLERFGYGYRDMAKSGYVWPIVDTRVRYLASASFGDELAITATLAEWEYRIKILYEVGSNEDRRIAEGYTVQVPVDAGSGEMLLSPTNEFAARVAAAIR